MTKPHIHAEAGTPHVHAALIKKWADGAVIEYLAGDGRWLWADTPLWQLDKQYRVKPEVTTSLSDEELRLAYYNKSPFIDFDSCFGDRTIPSWQNSALRAVADAAIKQYIKDSANKA